MKSKIEIVTFATEANSLSARVDYQHVLVKLALPQHESFRGKARFRLYFSRIVISEAPLLYHRKA